MRSVFRQLLQALGFLHSQRIVHRDVKPENVMLQVRLGAEEKWVLAMKFKCPTFSVLLRPWPAVFSHQAVASLYPPLLALQALDPVRIVLLDFGISRDAERQIRTATMTGLDPMRMGSAPYSSPEALGGRRREEASAPADMFAVGVMALEARCPARCWPSFARLRRHKLQDACNLQKVIDDTRISHGMRAGGSGRALVLEH